MNAMNWLVVAPEIVLLAMACTIFMALTRTAVQPPAVRVRQQP